MFLSTAMAFIMTSLKAGGSGLNLTAADTVIGLAAEEVVIAESLDSRERLVAAAPVTLAAVVAEVPPPELLDESPPEILAAVDRGRRLPPGRAPID